MTKHLLITTTALSLLTGIGMAAAQGQGMGGGQGGTGTPPAASGERGNAGGTNDRGSGGMNQAPRDVTPRAGQAEQGQRAGQPDQRRNSAQGAQRDDGARTPQSAQGGMDNERRGMDSNRTNAQSDRDRAGDGNRMGQGERRQNERMGQGEQRRNEPRQNMGQGEDRRNETTGQGAAGARNAVNVRINDTQRTRITQAINIRTAPRVSNINFNVAVGTRVPRTIAFHPLPATIVEVVPEYRGLQYFVVDQRIVIVDPATYEIVTIIDA